jgi:hypothetical protein
MASYGIGMLFMLIVLFLLKMTIALLEIAPHGHYTYVESIARIYAADPSNQVLIFTNERGGKVLQYLENQQIRLVVKSDTEGVSSFLKKIKNVDKLVVVTLESYTRELYHIAQIFEKTEFNCPIDYVLHNFDIWFQQSFFDKIRNVLYQTKSLKIAPYWFKVYFKYNRIHPKIIEKIKRSNGRFVTMSAPLAAELAHFVGEENVAVLPFSVFDGQLTDKSKDNKRLRICLAGQVSAVRRDYFSILNILRLDTEGVLRDAFDWDFLGKVSTAEDGQTVVEAAKPLIDKGYSIRIYQDYLKMADYDDELSHADIVLGNLILQQTATARYGKSKETGVIFTMIKAAKAGLLPADYPLEPALKSSVLTFTTYEEVIKILLHLHQNPEELNLLKAEALKNSMKYTPLSIFEKLNGLLTI